MIGHTSGVLIKGHTDDQLLCKRIGKIGSVFGLIPPAILLIMYFINKEILTSLYLSNNSESNTEQLARQFLLINLIGQTFDAFRNTASGALRGQANSKLPSQVNLATFICINLPASLIARYYFHSDLGVLSGRNISIAVGALIIISKWIQTNSSLNEDHPNGERIQHSRHESTRQEGCLQRFCGVFSSGDRSELDAQEDLRQDNNIRHNI